MSNIAVQALSSTGANAETRKQQAERKGGALLVWLAVFGLVGLAWLITRLVPLELASRAEYNLGLIGGILMLTLFLYPLRKHVKAFQKWGPTKHWFLVHMIIGIGGPFVILVHTQFHLGSVNAAVALFCMVIVAGSGVVGRFLYVEIHHGLTGEKVNMRELQAQAGFNSSEVKSQLHFAPGVEQRLMSFQSYALPATPTAWRRWWLFFAVGLRRRSIGYQCGEELRRVLRSRARDRNWDRQKYRRRVRAARRLVLDYLQSVQRVSQYTSYVRLFSLWHVLHVPLVYMLVLSAIAHVVAVHMY
jgi:hypothetical protein